MYGAFDQVRSPSFYWLATSDDADARPFCRPAGACVPVPSRRAASLRVRLTGAAQVARLDGAAREALDVAPPRGTPPEEPEGIVAGRRPRARRRRGAARARVEEVKVVVSRRQEGPGRPGQGGGEGAERDVGRGRSFRLDGGGGRWHRGHGPWCRSLWALVASRTPRMFSVLFLHFFVWSTLKKVGG